MRLSALRTLACTEMTSLKHLLWTLVAVFLLGSASMASIGAGGWPAQLGSPAGLVIPPGFDKVTSVYGAQLFRKNYQNGTPDFVQVADLSLGAEIKLLHGPIQEKRPGHGAYGGDDPRLLSRSLQQYWKDFSSSYANPFCVVNGQFFYMPESPTRLPFPLKVDGEIVSDGFGKDQFPGQKLMLELWPGSADIKPLSREALYNSTAPDIVAGLAEDARKAIDKYVGRTFVGLADKDGDRKLETVLIFTTRTARQKDAAEVLRDFGAQKVMMLDGGGSTQMICLDKNYISSERLIPQALAVQGGVPSNPFKAEISSAQIAASEQAPQAQPTPNDPPSAQIVQNESAQSSPAMGETAQSDLSASAPPAGEVAASSLAPSEPSQPLYELGDVLWVPGMMAPAMAFILLVVIRMRFS
jgi:hypothetical protein